MGRKHQFRPKSSKSTRNGQNAVRLHRTANHANFSRMFGVDSNTLAARSPSLRQLLPILEISMANSPNFKHTTPTLPNGFFYRVSPLFNDSALVEVQLWRVPEQNWIQRKLEFSVQKKMLSTVAMNYPAAVVRKMEQLKMDYFGGLGELSGGQAKSCCGEYMPGDVLE